VPRRGRKQQCFFIQKKFEEYQKRNDCPMKHRTT
jgi:hypothetical protein